MPQTQPPLSTILPPLICGTATFSSQYNSDPYKLPTTEIVHRALSLGVRAFDTSPYYGPAEQALDTAFVHENLPRHDYFLLTKVGRIGSSSFDYSAAWVRKSVQRSLKNLHTDYVDVVYCHDVEFVSAEDVLTAVVELRRLRDKSGTIKYVGISGYPVTTLCELAEMILETTGEPLDVVMSYANFTLQNTLLSSTGLRRLKAARVDVVPNASVLGMGLLRQDGVPLGAQGDWHPSPSELRSVVAEASKWCSEQNDKIEKIAIRYSIETWMRDAASVGSRGDPASGIPWKRETIERFGGTKLGVSVIGVSKVEELDETMRVWRSILDGLDNGEEIALESGRGTGEHLWSLKRQEQVRKLARGIRKILGPWVDFTWPSPPRGFVNLVPTPGQLPTPAASPQPSDDASLLKSNIDAESSS